MSLIDFFLEVTLDYLGLQNSRKNALSIKKTKKNSKVIDRTFRCELINSSKNYLDVLFPFAELVLTSEEVLFWDLSTPKNSEALLIFHPSTRKNADAKSKILNSKSRDKYFSLVLSPNSKIKLDISKIDKKSRKKVNFELAFKIKKMNSKIHIKRFKL